MMSKDECPVCEGFEPEAADLDELRRKWAIEQAVALGTHPASVVSIAEQIELYLRGYTSLPPTDASH